MVYRHKQRHNPYSHVKPLPPDKLERLLYGEPVPDQLIKKRLEEARQGTLIMPSMQEALTAAMQQQIKQTVADWSDDNTQPTQEKPMTDNQTQEPVGVTHALFNYVNKNPGRTRVEVCSALTAQGYKLNSVSSLINQNMRCGNFTDRDGMLYSNYATYRPIHSVAKYMSQTKAKAKTVKPTKAAHIAAGAPTAEDLRNALDVIKQSKALYEELHKIFGDRV